jgi:hypothetical protein
LHEDAGVLASEPLHALWAFGRFPQAGRLWSFRVLKEPFRSEIRTLLRQEIQEDLGVVCDALRAGSTVYLTPEGEMTRDGRSGRLRLALDRLWPVARTVWLAAVSSDPWVGRRMVLHVHYAPAPERERLLPDLHRRRVITWAHLLARAITAHPEGGSVESLLGDLTEASSRLAALDAIMTREAKNPTADWPRRLHRAVHRGVVLADGHNWRPGPFRHDPRMPHIPDVPAAWAAELDETLAALSEARSYSTRSSVSSPVGPDTP